MDGEQADQHGKAKPERGSQQIAHRCTALRTQICGEDASLREAGLATEGVVNKVIKENTQSRNPKTSVLEFQRHILDFHAMRCSSDKPRSGAGNHVFCGIADVSFRLWMRWPSVHTPNWGAPGPPIMKRASGQRGGRRSWWNGNWSGDRAARQYWELQAPVAHPAARHRRQHVDWRCRAAPR